MNLFEQSDLEGSPKINSEDQFVLSQFQASNRQSKVSSKVLQCNTFINDINGFNHEETNQALQQEIIKKEIKKKQSEEMNKQLAEQLNKQLQELQQNQYNDIQDQQNLNFQKEQKIIQQKQQTEQKSKIIQKPIQNQKNQKTNLEQNWIKKIQIKKFEFKKPSIKKFQIPKSPIFKSNTNLNIKINSKKTPQIIQERPQKKIILNKKLKLPLEKILEENPAIRSSLQRLNKENVQVNNNIVCDGLSDCENIFYQCLKEVCQLNRTEIFLQQKIKQLQKCITYLK